MTRPTATLDEANRYFETRPRATAWFQTEAGERENALRFASLTLDAACRFTDDAYELDADGQRVWRERVIAALCEQALWTLTQDGSGRDAIRALGIAQATVAGASVRFDGSAANDDELAPRAKRLLAGCAVFTSQELADGTISSTPLAL